MRHVRELLRTQRVVRHVSFIARHLSRQRIATLEHVRPALVGCSAHAWTGHSGHTYLAAAVSIAAVVASAAAVECEAHAFSHDYEICEQLGAGAFGTVYKAKCRRTGGYKAVKIINRKQGTDDDTVRREVAILQRVGMHRGVSCLDAFYETDDDFYLVMEFVEGGELFDKLVDDGAYSEAAAADTLRQVADAVAFLHAQGLIHADIKPENLLLTSRDAGAAVKLVDFGLTTEIRSAAESKPGTWAYWPPEAFENGVITKATDMWSLGVVLFVVLSGYHPFDPAGDAEDATLQERILRDEPDFDDPVWDEISVEAKQLIRSMLQRDASKRITIEQLLQSQWLHRSASRDGPLLRTEKRLRTLRDSTASLRAVAFATILQQRQRKAQLAAGAGGESGAGGGGTLRRAESKGSGGAMIEADMLANAFKVFDPEEKGYITEADLGRVLSSLGKSGTSTQELHSTLHEAAQADREGKRVLYGDFVGLMTQTEKRRYTKGDAIFREGDRADGFHLLLSGTVEVTQRAADGTERRLATLAAGEYFGENALLSGPEAPRNATVRCLERVEVLQLSRDDFEAGFLQQPGAKGGAGSAADAAAAARQTLGFIQMVSCMEHSALKQGECAFHEGDAGDRFYIIEEGAVGVEVKGKQVNQLKQGDCFGETALLTDAPRNATVRCTANACKLLSMDVASFSRMLRRSNALSSSLSSLAATRSGDASDSKRERGRLSRWFGAGG